MITSLRPAKPTFFWQGLLILLPAVALAGFGFFSLRQDRILALHDATERAKVVAMDVCEISLPRALIENGLSRDAVMAFRNDPDSPESDPILVRLRADSGHLVLLVNERGDLLYPSPVARWAVPRSAGDASAEQPDYATLAELRQKTATNQDVRASIRLYQEFLLGDPGAELTALATYELAVLLRAAGAATEAWDLFETVMRQYGDWPGETGLPLRALAAVQLLETLPSITIAEANRAPLLHRICATAVTEPSALTEVILEKARVLEEPRGARTGPLPQGLNGQPSPTAVASRRSSASSRWREVWNAHSRVRTLYQRLLASGRDGEASLFTAENPWLEAAEISGTPLLLTIQPIEGGGGFSLQARSIQSALQTIDRVLAAQRLPKYFGIQVEIAGRKLVTPASSASVLAAETIASASQLVPGLKVAVTLADPALLYGRQKVRTIWFGFLIALAMLGVFVGFFTAWRAFRRQAQLSEMKSDFVSSVSHELRAPLASVRLMAEELQEAPLQNRQKITEYHRFIVQECRRLSALVENVLDFSRHEQGRKEYEFEPTDLRPLVEETVNLMQPYALEKKINLAHTARGAFVELEVDGRAIQQVLVNLIDNAIKHSPANSAVEVGLAFESECALLSVEDHGVGIPASEHERIFERFYRCGSELQRETQGVGLGLAIVKYVVEAHGGSVHVRSQVGQGSRFTVRLPYDNKTVARS